MPIYRATCDEAGYERGSEKFSDCVLKQKSEEERVLIEKEKLEVEAKIAKDKQDAEDEKYDDEERERKEKKYKECLKRTSDLYGEPKAYCALELL